MGPKSFGIEEAVVAEVADEIRAVHELDVEIAVVIGGGNIVRGLAALKLRPYPVGDADPPRVTAGHHGGPGR